ncbi:uncharacterized protein LOC130551591 isoform X2 [Triplophysa rosa]|nr:uncharacterized protein LOC130551591 isoform X2 [Triplophysa rosa]
MHQFKGRTDSSRMTAQQPVNDENTCNPGYVSIYIRAGRVLKKRIEESFPKENILTAVRKLLQPRSTGNINYIHPATFKSRHLYRTNIFQELRRKFKCSPTICQNVTLQNVHIPELNARPPVLILLTTQLTSVFILPKFTSIMNCRHQTSFHILRKPTEKRKSRELESINCQEPNDKSLQDNEKETFAMSKDEQYQWESPSKKIKVILEAENTITHEANSEQCFLNSSETVTASANASKNWNYRPVEHDTEHDTYIVTNSNDKDQIDVVDEVSDSERYCGLRNQGATCYLNAVLQSLFMTRDFRSAVMKLELEKAKKKSVTAELQHLFRRLDSKRGSVATKGITKALAIENVYEEQDAAEYFQKILSMTEPRPAEIFQGTKKHSTTCLQSPMSPHETCEEIVFFSLTIPMEWSQNDVINVQKTLNAQFEDIFMGGEDQLYCEHCETKTDMKMSCIIVKLPQVLMLHMQRFYLDFNYMTYMKNNSDVEIPLELKVKEGKKVYNYDLYAIVNHIGSLGGGHYYAEIKSSKDEWYEFNDSTVQRIHDSFRVRCSQDHIISDTACLLFFKKSNAQQDKHLPMNVKISDNYQSQNQSTRTKCEASKEYCNVSFKQTCPHVIIAMPNELQQESQDHKAETNENSPQDVPDVSAMEIQPTGSDNQPKLNVDASITAEASKQSGMIFNMSDISHQKIPEAGACETGFNTAISIQSKGDNHHTLAKIIDSGITEIISSSSETQERRTKRANSWPQDRPKFLQTHSEQDRPQNNRINWKGSADSHIVVLEQKANNVDVNTPNDPDRALQQEPQDHKAETNENSSQDVTDTSEVEVQSTNGNYDDQTEQNNSSERQGGDFYKSEPDNENNEVVMEHLMKKRRFTSTQNSENVVRHCEKMKILIVFIMVGLVMAAAAAVGVRVLRLQN